MKRKRIDFLRLFGNSIEEERVMSVSEFYEHANTETEHPKLYIMAAVARALFCIANELDAIRRKL